MRKKATRKRPYFTMESAMTAILRDASGKMHHEILFARRQIFAKFATFQRAPLLSHLNFCSQFGDLAINRHFRHFRQNHHFPIPKSPFAISFEFLFTIWQFGSLIAISAIFAEIATVQRAPLPSHLNFCLQFGDFGN